MVAVRLYKWQDFVFARVRGKLVFTNIYQQRVQEE
jgi:hypothetical protein